MEKNEGAASNGPDLGTSGSYLSRADTLPETLVHQRKVAMPPPILRNQGNHHWPLPKDNGTRCHCPQRPLGVLFIAFQMFASS